MPKRPDQDPPAVIVLHLRPLPGPVPATVRLRRALKALLRVYGLRCTAVEPLPTPPPAARSSLEPLASLRPCD